MAECAARKEIATAEPRRRRGNERVYLRDHGLEPLIGLGPAYEHGKASGRHG